MNDTHETKDNLRYWFNQASEEQMTEGLRWYKDANDYVEHLHQELDCFFPRVQIAGVISALSPRNKWERNKIDAENVLLAVKNSPNKTVSELMERVKVCTFNANKIKAFNIAKGNYSIIEKSPKTYAFSRNVGLLDSDYVTIDSWHIRACNTKSHEPVKAKTQVSPKQYDEISEITKEIAEEMGLKAYEFQAVVWVTIRDYWTQ